MEQLGAFLQSKNFAGKKIFVRTFPNEESVVFANDLVSVFISCGLFSGFAQDAHQSGLWIKSKRSPDAAAGARTLSEGLTLLHFDSMLFGTAISNEIELVVGRKPEPHEQPEFSMLHFDGLGNVEVDQGAGKYVVKDGIHFSPETNGLIRVSIEFNRYFEKPPILYFKGPWGGAISPAVGETSTGFTRVFNIKIPDSAASLPRKFKLAVFED